jgi:hypothetical protein
MNRKEIKNWSIGSLLAGIVLGWAAADLASAQSWQPVTRSEVSNHEQVTQVDWEQRVQKRPASLQWQSGQSSAQYGNSFDPEATARVARRSSPRAVGNERPEVVEPGTVQYEPLSENGVYSEKGGRSRSGCGCGRHGGEAIEDGDCDSCDSYGCDECGESCDFGYEIFDGCYFRWFRDLSVFGGVEGFKSGADSGINSNFGVNEGLNLAGPLGDPWGCGYQLGFNAVQSDFSGTPQFAGTREGYRKQYFATAGLFRRAQCRGFQWGVAFDYLHDTYFDEYDVKQLRCETGFVFNDCWEFGYYGAYGVGSDNVKYMYYNRTIDIGKLIATDMFCLYLRRNFENGGQGRFYGGATGRGDGILGADLWIPLGRGFALQNQFCYMIPKQGHSIEAQSREAWGLGVNLIWYLGQNAKCMQQNPYRPLFNVADNSLLLIDRLNNK